MTGCTCQSVARQSPNMDPGRAKAQLLSIACPSVSILPTGLTFQEGHVLASATLKQDCHTLYFTVCLNRNAAVFSWDPHPFQGLKGKPKGQPPLFGSTSLCHVPEGRAMGWLAGKAPLHQHLGHIRALFLRPETRSNLLVAARRVHGTK